MTDNPKTIPLQQVALRLMAEIRQSRHMKATTYRKRFGDRLPKNFAAEVDQMEAEVEVIDTIVAAINDGKLF